MSLLLRRRRAVEAYPKNGDVLTATAACLERKAAKLSDRHCRQAAA